MRKYLGSSRGVGRSVGMRQSGRRRVCRNDLVEGIYCVALRGAGVIAPVASPFALVAGIGGGGGGQYSLTNQA